MPEAARASEISPRAGAGAVAALAFVVAVTAAWWALALWPLPGRPPDWLARVRGVCFNAGPDGLPDASGWLLLVGQPLGMVAVLCAGWGRALRSGLGALAGAGWGRALLATCALGLALGLAAAGVRVGGAAGARAAGLPADEIPAPGYPRLDREAPELGLLDQHGERLELGALRGRPALVTFAFGHCESVCPLVVRQTLGAQRRVRARVEAGETAAARLPRVVVVTLDPWRDTPARLRHLAEHWELGDDAFALSGEVEEVERVLDAWGMARRRDPQSGDLSHPPLVYVVDAAGQIAYASSGGAAALAELLERI